MTKTEATRAVKAQLRVAGLGKFPARSEEHCGGTILTVVDGDPELVTEALASLPGMAELRANAYSVVVRWEEA